VKCICDAETLLVLISTVARGVHGLFSEIKIKIQVRKAVQTWCCSFCPGSWLFTLFLCLCYIRVCYEYDSTKVHFWILSPSFHCKHWFVWTNFTINLEWIISSLRLLVSFSTQPFQVYILTLSPPSLEWTWKQLRNGYAKPHTSQTILLFVG